MEFAIVGAIVYVATLAFVAYMMWLRTQRHSMVDEMQKIRDEMSQLAMTVGLRHRSTLQTGPMPISPPK